MARGSAPLPSRRQDFPVQGSGAGPDGSGAVQGARRLPVHLALHIQGPLLRTAQRHPRQPYGDPYRPRSVKATRPLQVPTQDLRRFPYPLHRAGGRVRARPLGGCLKALVGGRRRRGTSRPGRGAVGGCRTPGWHQVVRPGADGRLPDGQSSQREGGPARATTASSRAAAAGFRPTGTGVPGRLSRACAAPRRHDSATAAGRFSPAPASTRAASRSRPSARPPASPCAVSAAAKASSSAGSSRGG